MWSTIILILILSVFFVISFGILTAVEDRPRTFSWPLFIIFLLALWIFGAYFQPLGVSRGKPWIAVLVFGVFLFLFALALTPIERLRFPRRSSPSVPPDAQTLSILSIGFFVWALFLFLIGLLFYNYWWYGWWPYIP